MLETLYCTMCGLSKSITKFANSLRHLNKTTGNCSTCWTKKTKEYYLANPDLYENKKLCSRLKQYGMTVYEYNLLKLKQNNKCASCGNPEKSVQCGKIQRLSVDHCHVTGNIRGLLCSNCNTALGLLQESEENILNLLNYLRSTRS